jgi:hypothetical protein
MSFLIFSLFALCLPAAAWPADAQESWSVLENRGLIISHIEIIVLPVFNPQNPKENHWVGRSANFIHIETQKNNIRPALLFKTGEPVNALTIHASERLLRSLPHIRDAEIIPSQVSDSTVIAVVRVRDAWSLKFSSGFSHTGGESEWSVTVREFNLLGLGKQVQVGYYKTIDRTLTGFAYQDPFLFNTRWVAFTEFQRLSDGTSQAVILSHPFYDVQTPWAAGFTANSVSSIQTFYNRGDRIYQLPSDRYAFQLFGRLLVSAHKNVAQRLGLELRATGCRYDSVTIFWPEVLPVFSTGKRSFHGFLLSWEFFQDDHIIRRNIDYVDKTEDFNLGWHVQLKTGIYPGSWGSTGDAFYAEGLVEKGRSLGQNRFFTAYFLWQNLWEMNGVSRFGSQSSVNFFDQNLSGQTWIASARFRHNVHLYPENVTYLGGTDGLRGYMNHFRIGDARWMCMLEDRVLTSWNFWGLVKPGFVAYLDAGGVRELATGCWTRTFVSVGAGLRFGNLKSSFGRVLSLTVATPLVREPGIEWFQIIFGTGD